MAILTELTFEIRDSLPDGVALCSADPSGEEEVGVGELFAAMTDGPLYCADHYVERLAAQVRERTEALHASQNLLRMTEREIEAHR